MSQLNLIICSLLDNNFNFRYPFIQIIKLNNYLIIMLFFSLFFVRFSFQISHPEKFSEP